MEADGIYEIREFIDDKNNIINKEMYNIKKEFQSLQETMSKVELKNKDDNPNYEEEMKKKKDIEEFLDVINNDIQPLKLTIYKTNIKTCVMNNQLSICNKI